MQTQMAWTLQVLSDIHLEMRHGHVPEIERHARFLALCGDIGRPFTPPYRQLLEQVSRKFEHVLLIAGNHCYYGRRNAHYKRPKTMSDIERQIRELTAELPNVTFLQNSAVMLEGVRVLGTTLWTYVPPELRAEASYRMNDYALCYVDPASPLGPPSLLTPEVTTALHQRAVSFLRRALDEDTRTPTVILTHHAPTPRNTQHPRYNGDAMQCCYATNLEELMRAPVKAWIFGHTHFACDQVINSVRVVSSPVGYPHERDCQGLTNPAIIKL